MAISRRCLKEHPEALIGSISLMRSDTENRGFWLGLPWRGKGLMTEACEAVTEYWFDVLGFPVLRVPKAAGNTASRRISEKQGMQLVGHGRGVEACRFSGGSFVALVEPLLEHTMRRTNAILWTMQILLALGFLFAGGMKLVTPAATLAPLVKPLPLGLIRFIGFCETAGALGLILPGLLHIRPRLTPMAAIGLTIIMSGAVSAMIALGRFNEAVLPAVFGILALVIASGRTFVARAVLS